MKIRSWIINKLGGITKEQQEKFRLQCENFAIHTLTAKHGGLTAQDGINLLHTGEDITVICSKVRITNSTVGSISIAPWCKYTTLENIIIIDREGEQ